MMNYVFFETGNDDFFLHLAEVFCSNFGEYFKKNIYKEVLQPGDEVVDMERVNEAIARHENDLTVLNCRSFTVVYDACAHTQCKKSHKVVLASDQVVRIEDLIAKSKTAIISDRSFIKDSMGRYSVQRLFECGLFANAQNVEKIKISHNKDPIGYKQRKPRLYLDKYIKKAAKIGKKVEAANFVYVCADTNSDYSKFKNKVESPNNVTVTSCELFQAI